MTKKARECITESIGKMFFFPWRRKNLVAGILLDQRGSRDLLNSFLCWWERKEKRFVFVALKWAELVRKGFMIAAKDHQLAREHMRPGSRPWGNATSAGSSSRTASGGWKEGLLADQLRLAATSAQWLQLVSSHTHFAACLGLIWAHLRDPTDSFHDRGIYDFVWVSLWIKRCCCSMKSPLIIKEQVIISAQITLGWIKSILQVVICCQTFHNPS